MSTATAASYDPSFDREERVWEAGMEFARLVSNYAITLLTTYSTTYPLVITRVLPGFGVANDRITTPGPGIPEGQSGTEEGLAC